MAKRIATPPQFGHNVRTWRRMMGWEQKDLAEMVGFSRPYVAMMEAGEPVSQLMLDETAHAFGVPLADLMKPVECHHTSIRWVSPRLDKVRCVQCSEVWTVGGDMLQDARVVEVSDTDGGYAYIRVPLEHPDLLNMGPVNLATLRDAIGKGDKE